jgi:PncC family amidohydrolase
MSKKTTVSIERMAHLLQARGWRLAVAESAPGGELGASIVALPGSSAYFWGGVIAYANDVKVGMLGVRPPMLARWGAVSPQVAWQMATGIRRRVGVEVGLSITGIAGPTGATAYKPVGLYYLSLAVPGECRVWRHRWEGDRAANNHAAVHTAIEHLVAYLGG